MAGRRAVAGVALLAILLIVALLSALAYQMLSRHAIVIAGARNSEAQAQALAYALGAETFVRQVLYDDFSQSGPGLDTLSEVWAQPLAPFELDEYDDAYMEIRLRDLHGCLNLNSLGGENAELNMERFKLLLAALGVPDRYAPQWMDWVDADAETAAQGAEDGEYLLFEPAYRTPNTNAGHVSELRLLPEMDDETYAKIRPFVCVLPSDKLRINVNTAPEEVLQSLDPTLLTVNLASLVESERAYTSVQEFISDHEQFVATTEILDVRSEYFEMQVQVHIGGARVALSSMLRRDDSGQMHIMARDLGTRFRSLFQLSDAAQESEG